MDEQNIGMQEQPLPYSRVREFHQQAAAKDPYFAQMPLAKFSELLNEATGTKMAQQGVEDNMIKRASSAVDRFIEPVSKGFGQIGADTFGMFSEDWREPGRRLGEGVPRSMAEMGAVLGGSALALGSGGTAPVVAGIAAWLGGAGSMGAKTYTETGSAKAGLTEAAIGGALPGFIKAGEAAGVAATKKILGEEVLGSTVKKLTARGLEEGGRQLGMLANSEAAIQGTSLAQGGGMVGLTPDHVFALTAGQIPFTMLDMGRALWKPQVHAKTVKVDGKEQTVGLQGSIVETQQGQRIIQGALDEQQKLKKLAVDRLTREDIQEVKQAEVAKMQLDDDPDVKSALNDFSTSMEVSKINKVVDKQVRATGEFKPNVLNDEYIKQLESEGIVAVQWDGTVKVLKQVGPTVEEIVQESLSKNADAVEMLNSIRSSPGTRQIDVNQDINQFRHGGTTTDTVQQMRELHGKIDPTTLKVNQDLSGVFKAPEGDTKEILSELHGPMGSRSVSGPKASGGELPIKIGGPRDEYTKLQYEEDKRQRGVVEKNPATETYQNLAENLTNYFTQLKQAGAEALPRVQGTMEQRLAALEDYHEKLYSALETVYEGHEFGLSLFDDKYPNLDYMRKAVKSGVVSVDEMYNRMTNNLHRRIAELYRAAQSELEGQKTFAQMAAEPVVQEQLVRAMEKMKTLEPKWLEAFVDASKDPVFATSLEPQAKMMLKLVELAESPEKLKAETMKFKKSMLYKDAKEIFDGMKPEALQSEVVRWSLHKAPFGKVTNAGDILSSEKSKHQEILKNNIEGNESLIGEGIDYNDPAELMARKEEAQAKSAEKAATQAKVRKYGELQQQLLWELKPTPEDWKRVGYLFHDGTRAPHVDSPNPHVTAQTTRLLNLMLEEFLSGNLEYEISRTRAGVQEFRFKYAGGFELLAQKIKATTGKEYNSDRNYKVLEQFIKQQFEPRLAALFDEQYQKIKSGPEGSASGQSSAPELVAEVQSLKNQMNVTPITLSTVIGTHTWFSTYFRSLGLDEGTAKSYADIAARIAAKVNGIDVEYKVGTTLDKNVYGVHYRPADLAGMILLNPNIRGAKELKVYQAFQLGGHELWHALAETAKKNPTSEQGQLWGQLYKWAADLSPEQRADIYTKWYNIQVPEKFRQEKFRDVHAKISEADAEEFLADMAGMGVLGVTSPDTSIQFRDELLFGTMYEQNFAKALYAPMFEIAKALEQHFNETGDGKVGTHMANIARNIEAMLSTNEEVQQILTTFAKVQRLDNYQSFAEMATLRDSYSWDQVMALHNHLVGKDGPQASVMEDAKQVMKDAKVAMGLGSDAEVEKWFGRSPHFLEKFFPAAQFAKLYPEVMPEFMLAVRFRGIADDMANSMTFPFGVKTLKSGVQKADLTGIKELAKDKEAYTVAGKLALENALNPTNLFTEAEMRAKMGHLSEKQQKLVIDWMNSKAKSMEVAMQHIIASDIENVSLLTARMLMMQKPEMKYQQALGASELIKKTLLSEAPTQQEVQVAAQAVQQLTAMLGPDLLAKAQSSIEPLLKVIQEKAQKFGNQPGYVSEVRMGQFMVGWRTFKNETGSAGFDTKAEAVKFAEAKADELGVDKVHSWDKYTEENHWASVNPDTIEFYQSIEQPAFERAMKDMGIDPGDVKYLVGAEAQRHAVANRIGGYQALKKFAQGRELIDPVEGTLEYISNLSASLTKRYIRGRIDLALLDPSLKNNPELQTWAQKHMQMTLYPEAKEWNFMKNSIFTYFLGFNFPSMLLNGSQGVFTVIPQYVRDTNSTAKAYKFWGKGVGESVEALMNNGMYKDPEMQEMVMQARKDKHITMGFMDELKAEEDALAPNFANLTKGNNIFYKGADLVKQPLWWYMKAARWMYSKAPEASSHATFVGAYRLYREHGMLVDGKLQKLNKLDAYNKAVETVYATEFGGGRAARPTGLFADAGKYQGAMGMMYSLGTYTWSTIAMMGRMGIESIARSGLTPQEKSAARKAFGMMLLTQTAAAGVVGLPFVGASLAILDQMFPTLEAKKNFKQFFQLMINGDKETGSIVSDAALKGIPSQMTGIDLTSKMGLQSLFGLNPYSGFSMLNMIGPAGGMFNNMLSAGQKAVQGEYGAALKDAVPVPYKNLMRLYQDGTTYRDPVTHEPMMQMGTKDAVLSALGFTPKAVADMKEAKQMIRAGEAAQSLKEKTFYERLAKQFMSGDVTGVRQTLIDRQASDPMFNAAAGARRVAVTVDQYNTPVDITRGGQSLNAHERMAIAKSAGAIQRTPETQRLMQRMKTEGALGVPGAQRIAPAELRLAQMVDQLMQMNPTLSRQEAQAVAYRMMGRRGAVLQGAPMQGLPVY